MIFASDLFRRIFGKLELKELGVGIPPARDLLAKVF